MRSIITEYPCPTCGAPLTETETIYDEDELIEEEWGAEDIWDDYSERFCPHCWDEFELVKRVGELIGSRVFN